MQRKKKLVRKAQNSESGEETLAGSVAAVSFHNPETGFVVMSINARGLVGAATLVGSIASIRTGEWVTATGCWHVDPRFGKQFKARHLDVTTPTTAEAIRAFLASGAIKGIGGVYADKIVEAFGADALDVIDSSPDRLLEIDGIGHMRAEKIASGWAQNKSVREIMLYLHSHGVSGARAARIYSTYGAGAIKVINSNPYRLTRDIRGIAFKTADEIAAKVGIEKESVARIRSGLAFLLAENTRQGNCGFEIGAMMQEAQRLLDVDKARITEALDIEISNKTVIRQLSGAETCIFPTWLYEAEAEIADRIAALSGPSCPWRAIDMDAALPWAEKRTGIALAPSQHRALELVAKSKFSVITGGPGVGKTTIINTLICILEALKVEITLCAPTGRAAKRLGEATGKDAVTIHRMLSYDPISGSFRRNEDEPLEADLLIVDEASMIDVPLMRSMLRAVRKKTAIMLVGDVDQLPSVGPGNVLASVIDSDLVQVVRLTEVFRQAFGSCITLNAHMINKGTVPDLSRPETESDFYFVRAELPEMALSRIIELTQNRIPNRFGLDPLRDIQVITPMNKGITGVRSLNANLQQALNPVQNGNIVRTGSTFARGDKVMQIQNDYDKSIFNGDVGTVIEVDASAGELVAEFDSRPIQLSTSDLDYLVLAYAVTVHKSQGSEYPAVVLPLLTEHFLMLRRNLLYTAITRGKRLVVIVGQKRALEIAVRNSDRERRHSRLKELLQAKSSANLI